MKPTLKTNKVYGLKTIITKIAAGAVSLTMLFGGIFGLVGCGKKGTETNTETDTSIVDTETDSSSNTETDTSTDTQQPPVESDTNTETDTNTPDVPVENTTYDEFMLQHGTLANQFALDNIAEISYNDKALSTTYSYVANEDAIEKIVVAQIVAGEGTTRELKIAEISFADGVDFDDIVSGENEFVPVITSETVLTFDAKEEYKKGDSSTIAQQIADEIAENLGDNAIELEEYKAETFAPESVEEWVEINKEEINSYMDKNYLTTFGKKGTIFFKEENMLNAKWRISGNDKIDAFHLIFEVKTNDSSQTLYAVSYTPETSIDIDEFLNSPMSISASDLTSYSFNYNPTIQGTRDDLMNAIFKANGMSEPCPDGAVRLFKDNGYGLDSNGVGESFGFEVMEIGKDKITKIYIRIKESSSDAEYISKLSNTGNYRIAEYTEIELDGEEVEYSAPAAATATSIKSVAAKKRTFTLSNGQEIEYYI